MITKRIQQTRLAEALAKVPSHRIDAKALSRAHAGSRGACVQGGGPPSRLASGEWMFRAAFDLPEAMLDALTERAGGDRAEMGELVRAALVNIGIGDTGHIEGICDGTYSDDDPVSDAREAEEFAFIMGPLAKRVDALDPGR